MIKIGNKTRPDVDPKSFELAEAFLSDYATAGFTLEEAAEKMEDAKWQLADVIQDVIEGWLAGAVAEKTLVEK